MMGEIELLNHLDHPNIVKYLATIKTKDYLNIVLEFVENGSLANTVAKFGSLPEGLIAVYIEQILQGLCYLHIQGVVHRDIKGANILTTKEGTVKLADFGVATRMPDGRLPQQARQDDDVAGSPYWMAPEVIEMSPATPAADVWSVGATIIELLTGSPPYFHLTAMAALFRIVQDACPPLPRDMSPALQDFLKQCFRKDAAARMTAKQLLSHKWIRLAVARRHELASVPSGLSAPASGTANSMIGRASSESGGAAISQDWNEVVERTLQLHEAAQQLHRKGAAGRRKHAKPSDAWHSTRRAPAARYAAAGAPLPVRTRSDDRDDKVESPSTSRLADMNKYHEPMLVHSSPHLHARRARSPSPIFFSPDLIHSSHLDKHRGHGDLLHVHMHSPSPRYGEHLEAPSPLLQMQPDLSDEETVPTSPSDSGVSSIAASKAAAHPSPAHLDSTPSSGVDPEASASMIFTPARDPVRSGRKEGLSGRATLDGQGLSSWAMSALQQGRNKYRQVYPVFCACPACACSCSSMRNACGAHRGSLRECARRVVHAQTDKGTVNAVACIVNAIPVRHAMPVAARSQPTAGMALLCRPWGWHRRTSLHKHSAQLLCSPLRGPRYRLATRASINLRRRRTHLPANLGMRCLPKHWATCRQPSCPLLILSCTGSNPHPWRPSVASSTCWVRQVLTLDSVLVSVRWA